MPGHNLINQTSLMGSSNISMICENISDFSLKIFHSQTPSDSLIDLNSILHLPSYSLSPGNLQQF